MQIITAEQRSPEWFAARLGIATGSRFADVLAGGKGLTRKAYAVQLALEIVTGKVLEPFTNQAMIDGTEREPVARSEYEALTGNFVTEVGFCRHDSVACGVSPDGLIDDDGGVEIKCPKATTHAGYLSMPAEPPAYTAQIQGCMWVTDRKWWDFVSYHPDFPENARLIFRRIKRDDEYISKLERSIISFADEVQAEVELIRNFRNAA